MKKRRESDAFSLSFLDIMCCGFAATVLLVMLLNGKTLQKREETFEDLRAKVDRVSIARKIASDDVSKIQKELQTLEQESRRIQAQTNSLHDTILALQQENEAAEQAVEEKQNDIAAMKAKIESLEKSRNELAAKIKRESSGKKKVGFDGEGRRQYLTGLKLGGDRTLILVDSSASMLDETVVNIVRRKLMDESLRRNSPKWRRVVRSTHWLVANLKPNKRFQVYYFNTQAYPVIQGTDKKWLNTNNAGHLEQAIQSIRELAPEGGTSLHTAFDVIRHMQPAPDSVLLLTDGLPTQGRNKPTQNKVSAAERQKLFNLARAGLPKGVPVNTLLFPLEGDPGAASSFWDLGIDTGGSFITPSRNWP